MQAIGIIFTLLIMLVLIAVTIIVMSVILPFRPFNYRNVAYRVGVLSVVAMILVVLGPMLDDGYLSPLRLQNVLEVLGLMVGAALFGAFIGYINFRFLRKMSDLYAKREEALAERKREKSRTRDAEGPVLDSERG